jgi:hypothetical protein
MRLSQYPEGIFTVLNGIVAGVGEKVGGLWNGITEGLGSSASAGASEPGVLGAMMDRMKDAMGFGEKTAPVIAASPVREPELGLTGPTTKENNVSMAELGTFVPSAVPMNVSRASMGMNA